MTSVPKKQGGLTTKGSHSVRGIAFGPNNQLYVADEGNDRVAVFNGDTGNLITTITNSLIKGPDQILYNPKDGLLYIASPGKKRIVTYNPQTNSIATFIHDSNLSKISGIAFGEDGNFYAGDRKAKTINQYVISSGAYTGTKNQFGPTFTDSPEGIMPLYDTHP